MALAARGGIEIEGLEKFQRAVSKAVDRDLPKRMQEAHKDIGRHIRDRWLDPKPDPRAVGEGRGATIRISGSRSAVILRAGGSHRQDSRGPDAPIEPWGVRPVGPVGPKPARPHIIGTADTHRDEIIDMYWGAVEAAMAPAFHDTKG